MQPIKNLHNHYGTIENADLRHTILSKNVI